MSSFRDALWIELRKAVRSRMPVMTALGFLVMPLAGAFLMVVLKDPAFALSAGLIRTKANLMGGSADWPSYLSLLAQATAVGGIAFFGLVSSWVFGREFADGTIKDLLAVPVSRSTILLAKFSVVALWCLALAAMIYVAGLGLGALIGLPQVPLATFLQGALTLTVTTCLMLALTAPVALLASVGRGYLLPLGVTFLLVVLAQLIAAIGWGGYFPWSVPALFTGMVGGRTAALEPVSYWIVIGTGLGGWLGTELWWRFADQSR